METLIGQTLDQYRIIERIGKGGMATVFRAFQPSLERYVAVKILPSYYAHEEGFSERFEREARAIARLDHPNILPVYDYGQSDGLSFIVMKYVAAGTLKLRMGQPVPLEETLKVLKQIAGALDHAHDQGILHRDVKPGNILIDEKGWVYLSDFGLAKMVEGSVQLTGSGVGVGTPAYMSPEQGQGLQVDGRTDVYALGVILYEMLTGRVPYEAETPMAVVVKHITSPLPLPRSINPAIPDGVQRVVLKALAKDPKDRFGWAGELVNALDAAMAGAGQEELQTALPPAPSKTSATMGGQPPDSVHRTSASTQSVAPVTAYQSQAPAKKSGLPMLALAGALSLVAVVGLVVVVALLVLLRNGGASRRQTDFDVRGPVTAVAVASPGAPALALVPTATSMSIPEPAAEGEVDEPATTPEARETQSPVGTPSSTLAPAPTEVPSPTFTLAPSDTPMPTFTSTPTNTPEPTATPTLTLTPTFTPTRPTNTDTGYRPAPIFNTMWEQLGEGDSPLGYPTGPAITDRNYAKQYFERGFMYWWQSPTSPEPIWVVAMPNPAANKGTAWRRYENVWDSSKSLFPPNCPEANEPLGPMAGFGVTWCDRPGVKGQVGAPLERESGSGDVYPKGAVQFFQNGVMFQSPDDRQIWALVEGVGWWRAGY